MGFIVKGTHPSAESIQFVAAIPHSSNYFNYLLFSSKKGGRSVRLAVEVRDKNIPPVLNSARGA